MIYGRAETYSFSMDCCSSYDLFWRCYLEIFKELIYPHRGKGEGSANGGPGQTYKESQWKVGISLQYTIVWTFVKRAEF